METPEKKEKKKMSFLTGATLFFVLVVYFNIRTDESATIIDWIVMGIGALFFTIALTQRIIKKKKDN